MGRTSKQMLEPTNEILPNERVFVKEYIRTGNLSGSYKKGFPELRDDTNLAQRARKLLDQPRVQEYIDFLKLSPTEKALEVFNKELERGGPKAITAATNLMKFQEMSLKKAALETWLEQMKEYGAEFNISKPGIFTVGEILEQVIKGEAKMRLPLDATLQMLKRAGAPWNDRKPDAAISDLQKRFLAANERFLYLVAAARTGKSTCGAMLILRELMIPNRRIAIIASEYQHVFTEAQYVKKGLENLFGAVQVRNWPVWSYRDRKDANVLHLESPWGSQLKGISLHSDDGASVLGHGFDLIVLGEGDLIPPDIYDRRVRRVLMGNTEFSGPGFSTGRVAIFTTSHFGEGIATAELERLREETGGDFSVLRYPKVEWEESYYVEEKVPMYANPAISKKAWEADRRVLMKTNPAAFAEQYEGKVRHRSDLIFHNFSKIIHMIPTPSVELLKQMKFVVGIDTGMRDFAVVLMGLDRANNNYVLAEVHNNEVTTPENCADIQAMVSEVLGPVIGTQSFKELSEHIAWWCIDPSSPFKVDIEDDLNIGLMAERVELEQSLELVNRLFVQNKLFISEDCPKLIKEINSYRYESIKRVDNYQVNVRPAKNQKDHLCDAMRYALIMGLGKEDPMGEPTKALTSEEAHQAFIKAYNEETRRKLTPEYEWEKHQRSQNVFDIEGLM